MNDKPTPQSSPPSNRTKGEAGPRNPLEYLRSRRALTYLAIFLVLMTASILMVPAVKSGRQTAAVILILVVVLANLLSLVF